jgi:hypothetical protein
VRPPGSTATSASAFSIAVIPMASILAPADDARGCVSRDGDIAEKITNE